MPEGRETTTLAGPVQCPSSGAVVVDRCDRAAHPTIATQQIGPRDPTLAGAIANGSLLAQLPQSDDASLGGSSTRLPRWRTATVPHWGGFTDRTLSDSSTAVRTIGSGAAGAAKQQFIKSSSRLASAELLPGSNCRSQTNRVTPASPKPGRHAIGDAGLDPAFRVDERIGAEPLDRRRGRQDGPRATAGPRRTSGPGPRSTIDASVARDLRTTRPHSCEPTGVDLKAPPQKGN